MIRSLAWFTAEHCGIHSPAGKSFVRPSPVAEELLAFIGRPVKYFSRMTNETKASLCAASIAMRDFTPGEFVAGGTRRQEIGLLAAGDDGCIGANQTYFRDYVAGGRSMGRGNLFIYTLPTSTLGELAIALALTGPTMYVHADRAPLATLLHQARQVVADGEAEAVLSLWSNDKASVCFMLQRDVPGMNSVIVQEGNPFKIAKSFAAKVIPAS